MQALESANNALIEPLEALDSVFIDFFADDALLDAVVANDGEALNKIFMPKLQRALLQAANKKLTVMGEVDTLIADIAELH